MDNSSTHEVALTANDDKQVYLPPSTTAGYQPMDAGVIAALKRRYKRGLLAIILLLFPVPIDSPPLSDAPPRPPPTPPTTPPSTQPVSPPSGTPPAPFGFRTENESLWINPTTDVFLVYGELRLPALEVVDDAADVATQADLLATVLSSPDQAPRPARNSVLSGCSQAHLMNAATLYQEEWEKVMSASCAPCWLKSTILHDAMSDTVSSLHTKYRKDSLNVEGDVNEVLSLLKRTALGREVVVG